MRISSLLFPTLLLSSFMVCAETHSDIIAIYEKALEQDATMATARAAAKAGLEKETQGLSSLLPQINATANMDYVYRKTAYDDTSSPAANNQSNASDSSNIAIQLTQPLFRLASFNAYSQSQLASNQSQLQLDIAEQNLILRVAKAYFDILSTDENLAVAKSQTLAFNKSLERAKFTFELGTAIKNDKLEAQARYDLARASELSALNQHAIAKQALASIIGEMPSKLQALKKNTTLLGVDPQDMQHWVDAATQNNLSLKLSQFDVKAAQLEIRKLKNDRMPTIDFIARGSIGKQYVNFVSTTSTTTNLSVGLLLSAPIYTGGLLSSRIREAEALRIQQKYSHIDILRQITLQAQQAYLTALNGFQQVTALKQAAISSESALEATRKGVEVGVRTHLDLLNSQQQFFETERDYTAAKYSYLLTVLELKAAAGNLTPNDIQHLNQLLGH